MAGRLHNANLAQAYRRLTTLGLAVSYEANGDGLEASLTPAAGTLVDPLDRRAIEGVELRVSAEGRVRITAPALLARAPERGWRELPPLAQLCAELQAALDKRHAETGARCAELARLGFEAEIEPETRQPVFVLEVDAGRAVVFECTGDEVVARSLHVAGGAPAPIESLRFPLRTLPERVDFTLQVAHAIERRRSPRLPPEPNLAVQRHAPPRGLTLGALLDALGPGWVLGAGSTLTCAMSLHGEGTRLQLELTDAGPLTLRLLGPTGPLWTRPLERSALAQWQQLAGRALGTSEARAESRIPAAQRWSAREEQLARGLLPPAAGEVWLMEVRVESDDGAEVRYRAVNVGGDDYGAPRVLGKVWFENTFAPAPSGGFRMLVRVVSVDEREVTYQRLDAHRESVGEPRRFPLVVFLASFVPEAGAY